MERIPTEKSWTFDRVYWLQLRTSEKSEDVRKHFIEKSITEDKEELGKTNKLVRTYYKRTRDARAYSEGMTSWVTQ